MTTVWILWDSHPDEAWDNNHRGIYATREAALRGAASGFQVPLRGSLMWTPVAGRSGLERAQGKYHADDRLHEVGFLERYEVKE